MIKWNYNDKVSIELPEATLKCFDELAFKQGWMALFLSDEALKRIRNKFKADFKIEE